MCISSALLGLSISVLCFEEHAEAMLKTRLVFCSSEEPEVQLTCPLGAFVVEDSVTLVFLQMFQRLRPSLQLPGQKGVGLCQDPVSHLSGLREDRSCAGSSRPMWISRKINGILDSRRSRCLGSCLTSCMFEHPVTRAAEGHGRGTRCPS